MIHQEVGDNSLSKKDIVPWYCMLLKELTTFFALLLWVGAILCFIGYGIQQDKSDKSNLYLGVVLVAVVLITGCFSYAQSSKTAEMIAQFDNFIPPTATVIRGGQIKTLPAKLIVPGDLVIISTG
jgi:sodium/potassium-transporting ATPase subunit alpha